MAPRNQIQHLGARPTVRPVFWWLLGGAVVAFFLFKSKAGQSAAARVAAGIESGAKKLLTLNVIREAMPNVELSKSTSYLSDLVEAMDEAAINTPDRIAAFLAQLGHESLDFKALSENLNYSADGLLKTFPKYFDSQSASQYARNPQAIANRVYANRLGNGDESSGDGWKYRGRGPIQLTGRANYRAFTRDVGAAYGVNFEAAPDLVSQPRWGFKAAAWYWATKNLNPLADAGNFDRITYLINGGYVGKEDRDARYAVAKAALAA